LQNTFETIKSDLKGVNADLKDVAAAADLRKPATRANGSAVAGTGSAAAAGSPAGTGPAAGDPGPAGPRAVGFDTDAT
ncbi:MAG TPA: hypothetical protein VHI50_01790, partial [Micromonosporaceae bacterium]|nr:hypothetical protein [Micromonosporaceae bacterium]